jgi:hypothetical protein
MAFFSTSLSRVHASVATLVAIGALAACGTDATHNKDYGQPPDPNTFNPGLGDNAGGYGSGGCP